MPAIDVVSDASVVLKWFHAEGEEEVEPARALWEHYGRQTIRLQILDLTPCEVGNALLRGRARISAPNVAVVLEALADICPQVSPTIDDLREAATLAELHGLTLTTQPMPPSHEHRGQNSPPSTGRF